MDADSAQAWFVAGTIPLMLGGGLHALASIVDAVRPTYFTPRDRSVKPAMESTSIRLIPRIRRNGHTPRSLWKIWIGINIAFGLAVFMLGLSWLLLASHDFELVESITALEVLTVAFPASVLLIAIRYWFWGPLMIAASATACFATAAVLS